MLRLSLLPSLFSSLYARLASILVLIILTMGFVYGFITYSATHDFFQETTQQFNRHLADKLVGERAIVVDGKINRQALTKTFHDYMTVNPNIEIYLLDLKGKILSYSADPGKVKLDAVSLQPIHSFLQGEIALGDDPRHLAMKKAFSVTYVPTQENPEGYLYVILRGEEFDQVNQVLQTNYVVQYSIFSLLISLAIGLFLGLLLFYTITRRVRNLSHAMRDFTQSGFSIRPDQKLVEKDYKDEIGYLANSFDTMAEHTIAQLFKLDEQDRLRRELVANISHDLRTPLASMLGYLETLMIKKDSLNEQEREQYLKIVNQQGRRLNHLIGDLFELAKFDAKEINLNKEVFSFSEFIHDVVQKFQPKAEKSAVSIQLICPQEALLVNADIALIERVLDNLISNAFNHTKSGDQILVKISQQSQQIDISIQDTGCGIHQQDIDKVFNRSYQAQNKHRKGSHAGLGLAIVKRIVDLHERNIKVTSEFGKGSQFTFSLLLIESCYF